MWQEVEKKTRRGVYSGHDEELALIVTKSETFRLTQRLFEKLKRPDYVLILKDGRARFAFKKSDKSHLNAFKITTPTSCDDVKTISAKTLITDLKLEKLRVLYGREDGDMVIFDTAQTKEYIG